MVYNSPDLQGWPADSWKCSREEGTGRERRLAVSQCALMSIRGKSAKRRLRSWVSVKCRQSECKMRLERSGIRSERVFNFTLWVMQSQGRVYI